MKPIRLLIVEDDGEMLSELRQLYRRTFADQGVKNIEIDEARTSTEARSFAKAARGRPYDLVSLDVNLGEAESTGLDVLASLRRFGSAWAVALLTGLETDPTLDATFGLEKAEAHRKNFRILAEKTFSHERLRIFEKPSSSLPPEQAARLLADRIVQITMFYDLISRTRYIFRPIDISGELRLPTKKKDRDNAAKRARVKTVSVHWQIRFDCGEIRTLPDRAGLKTLHHILSLPRHESLTPEEALVIEPIQERIDEALEQEAGSADPVASFFESQGINWNGLEPEEQDKLIAAALSLRFKRYVELREYEEEDDLTAEEEDELEVLVSDLGPLAEVAETGFQRLFHSSESRDLDPRFSLGSLFQDGLRPRRGDYEQSEGRRGKDSRSAANFRKRMERTRKLLRESGFVDFAQHLEDHLTSTGANWSYHPPEGIEWAT
ncbi:MAG: hypothetical protein AAF491_01625 [Verrucomicrobiota bacterium]